MGVYVGFLTYGGFFYYLNSLFILKRVSKETIILLVIPK